jgi:hypothetical protein
MDHAAALDRTAELEAFVRRALALSDALGRYETSAGLNDALVTLDGVGDPGPPVTLEGGRNL